MIKLKNSNGDKSQKLKMWQNLTCDKTQVVTKLKLLQNSSCDKTQSVTKLKLTYWQNLDCDKTWELELWQLKNSNCD